MLVFVASQSIYAQLSITPSTWNVAGLDSNNVTVGPDTFFVGLRVCNTSGTALTNVTGTFVWDSSNSFISLINTNPVRIPSLAANSCSQMIFNVQIVRSSAAFNATRRYHINVGADNAATVSTVTPREIYVEKLVSQNRNSTDSITGPSTVIVGQTYNFTVIGSTATGGYEQFVNELVMPNSIFQIMSISSTYTAPAGAINNQVYADACGWDNNPLGATYRSCIGPTNFSGGKAGGKLQTTYTVKVVGAGSATMSSLIYDFSGSSYHYNSDMSATSLSVTAVNPPNVALVKSVSPTGTAQPGTDLTYTIQFTNSGGIAATGFVVSDPIPTNTDFKVGSTTTTLGGFTGVSVQYSSNNGSTWAYTPVSGGGGATAGYDRTVTNVRWVFTGSLGTSGTGNVTFAVRIR
jgi:uncharacterized repeat protein (TIGR01451 family)